MKFPRNQTLMLIILVLVTGYGYIISCTHKDEVLPAAASGTVTYTHGNAVHLPGLLTPGDTTMWKFDQVHSSVLWSGSYLGASGLLTGRFNAFGIANVGTAQMITYATGGQPLKDSSWAFYENDPTKIYFNGYVQINTSNTGEPARDSGCNIAALGTVKVVPGTQNLTVTNIARIQTTSVTFDPAGSDYIVNFNMTWQALSANPVTQALVGKLTYVPETTVTEGTSTFSVFGLRLDFQFNCRDFGVTSPNIGDNINIQVNANFNNK